MLERSLSVMASAVAFVLLAIKSLLASVERTRAATPAQMGVAIEVPALYPYLVLSGIVERIICEVTPSPLPPGETMSTVVPKLE